MADGQDSAHEDHEGLDTSVPQTARIWNYWLGGKDNFAVDRQVGDQIRKAFPDIVQNARASRAFLVRSVSYVTDDAGIRQFLDVGTGLSAADNTHLDQPLALIMSGALGHITGDDEGSTMVGELLRRSPPAATSSPSTAPTASSTARPKRSGTNKPNPPYVLRGRDQFAPFSTAWS